VFTEGRVVGSYFGKFTGAAWTAFERTFSRSIAAGRLDTFGIWYLCDKLRQVANGSSPHDITFRSGVQGTRYFYGDVYRRGDIPFTWNSEDFRNITLVEIGDFWLYASPRLMPNPEINKRRIRAINRSVPTLRTC
jgi:hypothetical protein